MLFPFCSFLQPLGWFSHSSVEKSLTSRTEKSELAVDRVGLTFKDNVTTSDIITVALRTYLPRRCVPTWVEVRLFEVGMGSPSLGWLSGILDETRPLEKRRNRAKEPKVRALETFPLCPSSVGRQGSTLYQQEEGRDTMEKLLGVGHDISCLPGCLCSHWSPGVSASAFCTHTFVHAQSLQLC